MTDCLKNDHSFLMLPKRVLLLSIYLAIFCFIEHAQATFPIIVRNFLSGHYYSAIHVAEGITWDEAKRQAELMGGYLAVVTTKEENDFLFQSFPEASIEFHGYWLGGQQLGDITEPDLDPAAGWTWVNGEAWEFTDWHPGEPNDFPEEDFKEDALLFWGNIGKWNDLPRESTLVKGFFVEFESPAPTRTFPANNHRYAAISVPSGISWGSAKLAAEQMGGYLATVQSQLENEFLLTTFPEGSLNQFGFWLGGFQPEDMSQPDIDPSAGWEWVTGEPWDFTNWHPGEPNDYIESNFKEDALHFWEHAGGWNDSAKETLIGGFFVEFNNDGHPIIIQHPANQKVFDGADAVFSAIARSGTLQFQWYRNNIAILGETSSTLLIPNASSNEAGNYHVRVSNEHGTTDSSTATLAVHVDLGKLIKITPSYGSQFTAPASAENLVVVTHGLTTENAQQHNWIEAAAGSISRLVDDTWHVTAYRWPSEYGGMFTLEERLRGFARVKADAIKTGKKLGFEIFELGKFKPGGEWKHIHFIGHSAGGALIDAATKTIKNKGAVSTVIHTTFLDPFEGIFLSGDEDYGGESTWSDNYFSKDISMFWTEGAIQFAFNVDVTGLDTNAIFAPVFSSGTGKELGVARVTTTSHSWPWQFYTNTIPPSPGFPLYGQYGFSRSKEAGGWEGRHNYPRFFEDTLPTEERIRTPGETLVLLSQKAQQSSSQLTINQDQTIISQETTISLGNNSFRLGKQLRLEQKFMSKAAEPPDNAWISIGLSFTNPVNSLSFEAEFSSDSTNGLLSVYLNGHLLGLIDQDYATSGLQKYSYFLDNVFYDRPNTLGFRLDGTNTAEASIMVTNLAVAYFGLPETSNLQPSLLESNKFRVEISGISGHPYTFQSSINLIDWEPLGIVLVTNAPTGVKGNVIYEEPIVTGEKLRYLRVTE